MEKVWKIKGHQVMIEKGKKIQRKIRENFIFFPFFSVTIRRTRSKSGSPPSRVGSSIGFRSGIHAGQPVSLPPIFNVSNPEIMTSGPTSLTSGYSSMSSRLGTANSSSSNLTPRSSSNLRLDGKVKWISNYFSSKNNIFFPDDSKFTQKSLRS